MTASLQLVREPRVETRPVGRSDFEFNSEMQFLQELSGSGYGSGGANLSALEVELLLGDRGTRSCRVEGLAPMDLMVELDEPAEMGELVALRVTSRLGRLQIDTLGLVHWQRRCARRVLAGLFLREALPDRLLAEHWMDMRQELRFPVRRTLWARFGNDRERHEVQLTEYSRSGARLVSPRKTALNQKLELYDDDLIAAGVVRFMHAGVGASGVQVGCEFKDNAGVRLSQFNQQDRAAAGEAFRAAESWKRNLPRDRYL